MPKVRTREELDRHARNMREWRKANPAKAKAADRRKYEANKKNDPDGLRERGRRNSLAWRKRHPEKSRASSQKYNHAKYGMTPEEKEVMLAEQGGCCAICKSTEPGNTKGWNIDHCHATGAVRGILCHQCNTGLGLLGDTVESLQVAIDYLNRNLSR